MKQESLPGRSDYGCAVRLNSVTKIYDRAAVVDQLSLSVEAGEVFGLLGPNGAGKTTVMKMIAGLARPDGGSIHVFGCNTGERSNKAKSLIGLVPQDNNMERELTVEEALLVYGRLHRLSGLRQRIENIIEEFSLGKFRQKRVGILSGGMARRALIARALLAKPKLLLLDEPTVGLDPDIRQEIWQIVGRLIVAGITVILTTHYMEEADRLCSRVAMLQSGHLAVLDTPDGIKERLGIQNSTEALETAFIRLAREGGDA
ncbi:MAG: ABC transporter ATP-binding protein [Veillonellales bacterium]